jgi:exopolysaccharide biosynthesis polyprenyl glycosylphosphotransferase
MGSVQPIDEQAITGLVQPREVVRAHEHFELAVSIFERLGDLIAATVAACVSYYIYSSMEIGLRVRYPIALVAMVGFLFAVTCVVMLDHGGAYEKTNSLLRIRETERVLRVSTQAFAIAFSLTFFIPHCISRWVVLFATLLVPFFLIIEKQICFTLIRHLHSRGYGLQNVLIYGAGFTGRRVFSALASSPKMGLNPVAIVDDAPNLSGQKVFQYGYSHERWAPVVLGPLTRSQIEEWGAALIVVGIPSLAKSRLDEIAKLALDSGARIAFVPQLSFEAEEHTNYAVFDGLLIASLAQPSRHRIYELTKRAFDIVASLLLLVLNLPLWLLFAVAIRLDSRGPVFFRQTRVGKGGGLFCLYKFRTMRTDAPKFGLHPTDSGDPRITRLGSWLRRTSLDELPQLINVLKGDMSLVGPRPEMPFIVETYESRHLERLKVTPGLTGLWQLSADRRYLIHENIQYDLYYIRYRSFFFDLAILLHTAIFAMKGI